MPNWPSVAMATPDPDFGGLETSHKYQYEQESPVLES